MVNFLPVVSVCAITSLTDASGYNIKITANQNKEAVSAL